MITDGKKVRYIKSSDIHGTGKIPLGSVGMVMVVGYNSTTDKALVDFSQYGKAVIPISCLEVIK